MRRPLFMAALCLVIIIAVWPGIRKDSPAPDLSASGSSDSCSPALLAAEHAGSTWMITGQVYRKEGKSIYLKSVVLVDGSDKASISQMQDDTSWQVLIHEAVSAKSLLKNKICEKFICQLEKVSSADSVPVGSRVLLEGTLASFSRATNPGEFDKEAYYRILGVGGCLKKARILARDKRFWPVREAMYGLRQLLHERLYRILPEKEAAVMCALLLGEKSELDRDLKALYKRSGILHIFSISSLHITIIGMSVYKLLRRLRVPMGAAAFAGSVILLLYGCLAGFGVSACRAIGMYLIRMLGEILGRTYDILTALGVMAALMVWSNPLYLQHSGFLLSFTSVIGIVVVAPALFSGEKDYGEGKHRLETFWKKIRVGLKQSAAASISITLATLPVQLMFYYEVPVYSVGVNLLVLPFMKPLMFAGILALVPGFGGLGRVDGLILGWYETLCSFCSKLPCSVWNPGCPKTWQVWLYYLMLGGVVLATYWLRRMGDGEMQKAAGIRDIRTARRVWRILLPVILTGMVWILGRHLPEENKVTFLDVGQGDCCLVQTASGEHFLFDCGSSSRSKVGEYVLLPFLKFYGIHEIDAIFLSHPDADHVNGAKELLSIGEENGIKIGQLVLPDIAEDVKREQLGELAEAAEDSVQVRYIGTGDTWKCKSAVFTCLHPQTGDSGADKNAYSECVYVEFLDRAGGQKGFTLLLTGDVEDAGEEALTEELARRNIREVTILKAAHHGSASSTSQKFVEQINPRLAVISCGRDNRYGHPHREVVERLEEAGCVILRTDEGGAVTAWSGMDGVRIVTYVQ